MATDPTTYTVKSGDTLNGIANSLGYKTYTDAGISGYGTDPNKIAVGQVLSIGGGPKQQDIPGIGTLTIKPKAIPTGPVAPASEDLSGAYARYGITPPPAAGPTTPAAPSGYTPPSVAGMPSYPSAQSTITDAYKTTLDTIKNLEGRISSSSTPTSEEIALRDQLTAAKNKLNQFDVGTLSAEEGLHGQGRGATLGTIDTRTTILDRTRALERLGFATEAEALATQLTNATADRHAQGDVAKTEYDLASKKLDIALGLQDKITQLNQNDRNNARQYLLDVVNFGEGKAYDQLSPDTQAAITHAVANSPITLDMVKTALSTAKEKFDAQKSGNLRSVAGVGVVQINADGSYKVVVPEHVANHTSPSVDVPSFNDYLAAQNIPVPSLTPAKIQAVQDEYNAKYSGATVSLGKLSPTSKNDLAQAGLSGAPAPVQSYFINTPAGFRDQYQRDLAAGKVAGVPTLDSLNKAYTAWYTSQKKSTSTSGGTHDFSAFFQ